MRDVKAREGEPGWLASLLGAGVLIAGGFALGLVAGVVSEEPELVVGHLVGRSEEAAWLPDAEPRLTPPSGDVALLEAEPLAPAPAEFEAIPLDDADHLGGAELAVEPPPGDLPSVAAAPPAPPVSTPARRERRGVRDIANLPSLEGGSSVETPNVRQGFSVQVGAFADGDAAEDVRRKLRGKGFDSYVISAAESGDGKWRVRVGPVATKGGAERLASRLKTEERLPTWVLTEGGG